MELSILMKYLFDRPGNVYAVLDGAAIPDLLDKLYGDEPPEFECLYRGELEPDMAEVAPYLITLRSESNFTDWLVREGWGKHWGVYASTAADPRTMRSHFRKLLTVHDINGKPTMFRFYDPRVLRAHLPTCSPEGLEHLFGAIDCYLLEDEESTRALGFRLEKGQLKDEKVSLTGDAT